MTRRRGKRSNTMPIMFMIAFLLAVLVGLAILLAPEREPAPPASSLHYEERPRTAAGDLPPLAPYRGDTPPTSTPVANADPESVPRSAPQEAAPDAAYAIQGQVVDEKTGAPVPDVPIVASRIPTGVEKAAFQEKDERITREQDAGAFDALIEEKQRLWADAGGRTDAQGRFALPIAHEGDYKITTRSPRHLRTELAPRFVGETNPLWEVTIELGTGATIAGRVYDSDGGQGIPDIRVNATLENEHRSQSARTDAEGRYEIPGLHVGTYAVIADIDKTAYRVTRELPYKRETITGPEQVLRGVDFKLDRGGVVWGYVTTPDNEPVKADVVLSTSESVLTQALSAMVRQAPPLNTNSDEEDGYYELLGVPLNEQWRLYATSDETAPQLADPFVLTDRQKEARVDIYMFTGANVFGKVVDDEGAGVPEAQVLCIPGFGQLLAPMDSPQAVRETRSGGDGAFEIRELPPGNYQVLAQKDGYKFALRGEPLYSDGYHEIKGFRVVLEPVESGKYSVFGTVQDSDGSGLSGARVTLSGVGTTSMRGVGRETTTGGGGAFEFDGVEIGTYILKAEMEGYSPKTQGRVLFDEHNYITLRAAASVQGRVLVKSSNAAPESGYTVQATLLDRGEDQDAPGGFLAIMESATTADYSQQFNDPQGHYRLDLPAGTWQLEARAANYAPARQTVTLQPGRGQDGVDLHLSQEGGRIAGHVIVTDGSSPQGAMVSLVEAGSASRALTTLAAGMSGDLPEMRVGQDGFFEFDRLPAGTFHVVAKHPAYPQAMSPSIPLEAGGAAEGVEVRLGPGGTLEGYVYRNGRPVSGTVVTLIAGGAPYTGTSDENGYYEITNIPEGEYEVFAGEMGSAITGDSLGGQGYPVIIADGLVTRQNFGDSSGVAIEIAVDGRRGFLAATLNPPGAPVFQGEVELGQLTGYRSYVYGDVVRFEEIPIGEWQLDIYAGTALASSTLEWVGTEIINVTGEEEVMQIGVVAQ